jgi:hypothetical protein
MTNSPSFITEDSYRKQVEVDGVACLLGILIIVCLILCGLVVCKGVDVKQPTLFIILNLIFTGQEDPSCS